MVLQGPLGMEQISFESFGLDQVIMQISRTFWHRLNILKTRVFRKVLDTNNCPAGTFIALISYVHTKYHVEQVKKAVIHIKFLPLS